MSVSQFFDLSIRDVPQTNPIENVDVAVRSTEAASQLYGGTARALRLHSLPKAVPIDLESERWFTFLSDLRARADAGSITLAQRTALLSIWDRAQSKQLSLRRPAVGVANGILQASWSFADVAGKVFAMELHGDGMIEWFYRDQGAGVVHGTDDAPVSALPDEAVRLLTQNFSSTTSDVRAR